MRDVMKKNVKISHKISPHLEANRDQQYVEELAAEHMVPMVIQELIETGLTQMKDHQVTMIIVTTGADHPMVGRQLDQKENQTLIVETHVYQYLAILLHREGLMFQSLENEFLI